MAAGALLSRGGHFLIREGPHPHAPGSRLPPLDDAYVCKRSLEPLRSANALSNSVGGGAPTPVMKAALADRHATPARPALGAPAWPQAPLTLSRRTRSGTLPTALGHACDVAFERQLAKTQTAEREFSHVGARPAAQTAPVAQPNLELWRLLFSSDLGGCGHGCCLLRGAKRHPDKLQQLSRLFVGFRRRHDRHVHSSSLVDLHVVDFRKNQLVAQAERVVAAAVETAR